MTDFRVCLVTAPNQAEAKNLARLLLEQRLAACVNLVETVTSIYWWQGEIQEDTEVLMIIKTQVDLVEPLIDAVRGAHSYQVCEVISLPIEAGNPAYLNWLRESVTSAQS
jgi:periplasmic divalent cation tolerance protein